MARHGLPVVFTRHESVEPVSPLRPDGPGCAFKPELQPLPTEQVVAKSTNGAFFGTDLELRLRRLGVDRLVVAGFFTNMCVETTVRTAGNLGYDTYLAHDACSTTSRTGVDGTAYDAEVVHALAVATMHGEFCTALTHPRPGGPVLHRRPRAVPRAGQRGGRAALGDRLGVRMGPCPPVDPPVSARPPWRRARSRG